MTIKAGLIILKHLLQKTITRKFVIWKFLSPKKRPRNVSKIPLPRSVKDSLPRDKTRPDSPGLRVPKSDPSSKCQTVRPTSAPPKREKNKDDVGVRLFNKAQEIEQKKQNIRKSLRVNYSFKPTLAENTNRWLNRSSRENHKDSYEEIAVVSSASILNFTKSSLPISLNFPMNSEHNYPFKLKPGALSRSEL